MTKNDLNSLIGKSIEVANKIIPDDYFIHPNQIDDKIFYQNTDLNFKRINVIIYNNLIVKAHIG